MSEEKVRGTECLPVGVVTMLLTGYLDTINKLTISLMVVVAGWVLTTIAFILYMYMSDRW